jgi:hypothetical protein
MEKRKVTSAGYLRLLTLLYAAMFASQVLFAGTCIFLQTSGEFPPQDPESTEILTYALVAVGSIGLGMSFLLFSRMVNSASEKSTLSEKLRGYQTASIVRFALLEAPSMLGIVGFLMSGQYAFFIATVVVLMAFGLIFPTKSKIIENLRLTHEETQLINDPNAVVAEFEVSNN